MVIQIIASVFILFVLARTVIKFAERAISLRLMIFWIVFWACAALLFWMPSISDRAARFLQVGRGVDAITYIALVILFYFAYKFFLRFESLERQLTEISSQIALDKPEERDE
ncbi:MAG: hypothetical protein ACD_76C00079G0002 [uncultured bacterium]|nr:MAG: hypothetical protein ACD_76C00079G0002 [uncultured bacterium]